MTSPTNEQRIFKWRVIEIVRQQKKIKKKKKKIILLANDARCTYARELHTSILYFECNFQFILYYVVFCRTTRWTQKHKRYVKCDAAIVAPGYFILINNPFRNCRFVIQNLNEKQMRLNALDEFEMDTRMRVCESESKFACDFFFSLAARP